MEIFTKYYTYFIKVIFFTGIVYASILYAHRMNLLDYSQLLIIGNDFLDNKQIEESISINEESIFNIDLSDIQAQVESLDYVKSAKVSRIFPSTIMVEVVEREPMVLAKFSDQKYFFDVEFTPLPATKNSLNFFPVPLVTIEDSTHVKLGEFKLTKALRFVKKSKEMYSHLYENLSEIHYNGNHVSMVTDERTRINLGDEDVLYKVKVLKAFDNALQQKKTIQDYSFINLDVDNQIIVRERKRGRRNL